MNKQCSQLCDKLVYLAAGGWWLVCLAGRVRRQSYLQGPGDAGHICKSCLLATVLPVSLVVIVHRVVLVGMKCIHTWSHDPVECCQLA